MEDQASTFEVHRRLFYCKFVFYCKSVFYCKNRSGMHFCYEYRSGTYVYYYYDDGSDTDGYDEVGVIEDFTDTHKAAGGRSARDGLSERRSGMDASISLSRPLAPRTTTGGGEERLVGQTLAP